MQDRIPAERWSPLPDEAWPRRPVDQVVILLGWAWRPDEVRRAVERLADEVLVPAAGLQGP